MARIEELTEARAMIDLVLSGMDYPAARSEGLPASTAFWTCIVLPNETIKKTLVHLIRV
jgi:hypothetical protein